MDSLTHHHWTGILLIVLKYVLSPFVNIVYHLDSSHFASCLGPPTGRRPRAGTVSTTTAHCWRLQMAAANPKWTSAAADRGHYSARASHCRNSRDRTRPRANWPPILGCTRRNFGTSAPRCCGCWHHRHRPGNSLRSSIERFEIGNWSCHRHRPCSTQPAKGHAAETRHR